MAQNIKPLRFLRIYRNYPWEAICRSTNISTSLANFDSTNSPRCPSHISKASTLPVSLTASSLVHHNVHTNFYTCVGAVCSFCRVSKCYQNWQNIASVLSSAMLLHLRATNAPNQSSCWNPFPESYIGNPDGSFRNGQCFSSAGNGQRFMTYDADKTKQCCKSTGQLTLTYSDHGNDSHVSSTSIAETEKSESSAHSPCWLIPIRREFL